ncbi:unnamed protein product, partial [marine sediment metagenome]
SNHIDLEKDLEISKENLEIVKKAFGKKLVLKILSPDIVHKTEVGGIKIIDNDSFEIKKNYKNMLEEVRSKVPDVNIFGVMISNFIKPKFELIVSILNDPQFGPVFSVGLGGIYTELFKDIVMGVAPVTFEKLKNLIKKLKCHPILYGYRGSKIVNEEKLLSTLMAINQLSIFSLDFNGKRSNDKKVSDNSNEKNSISDIERFSDNTNFSDYIIDEFEINPLAITEETLIIAGHPNLMHISQILHFSSSIFNGLLIDSLSIKIHFLFEITTDTPLTSFAPKIAAFTSSRL